MARPSSFSMPACSVGAAARFALSSRAAVRVRARAPSPLLHPLPLPHPLPTLHPGPRSGTTATGIHIQGKWKAIRLRLHISISSAPQERLRTIATVHGDGMADCGVGREATRPRSFGVRVRSSREQANVCLALTLTLPALVSRDSSRRRFSDPDPTSGPGPALPVLVAGSHRTANRDSHTYSPYQSNTTPRAVSAIRCPLRPPLSPHSFRRGPFRPAPSLAPLLLPRPTLTDAILVDGRGKNVPARRRRRSGAVRADFGRADHRRNGEADAPRRKTGRMGVLVPSWSEERVFVRFFCAKVKMDRGG